MTSITIILNIFAITSVVIIYSINYTFAYLTSQDTKSNKFTIINSSDLENNSNSLEIQDKKNISKMLKDEQNDVKSNSVDDVELNTLEGDTNITDPNKEIEENNSQKQNEDDTLDESKE